jgi:hypothetical protein
VGIPVKFESSHPGGEGKTIVQKIQDKADKAYKYWREDGEEANDLDPRNAYYGRWEGVCAALGILRGSSTQEEMRLSEERIEAAE